MERFYDKTFGYKEIIQMKESHGESVALFLLYRKVYPIKQKRSAWDCPLCSIMRFTNVY
ncbi:MAG: hypothetical protein HFJ09_15340 [Lachnospiraceae bacterium]|nr:hypothetical protein [Lachnospiraceae bacterium]